MVSTRTTLYSLPVKPWMWFRELFSLRVKAVVNSFNITCHHLAVAFLKRSYKNVFLMPTLKRISMWTRSKPHISPLWSTSRPLWIKTASFWMRTSSMNSPNRSNIANTSNKTTRVSFPWVSKKSVRTTSPSSMDRTPHLKPRTTPVCWWWTP